MSAKSSPIANGTTTERIANAKVHAVTISERLDELGAREQA